ncbi:MAG: hypothetical protein NVS9B10_24200 [Nevskia sp.]
MKLSFKTAPFDIAANERETPEQAKERVEQISRDLADKVRKIKRQYDEGIEALDNGPIKDTAKGW